MDKPITVVITATKNAGNTLKWQ